jgi:hypothetical protein
MVIGSTLVNPHVLNLTSFFIWTWSLLPVTWSNAILRSYIALKEFPSKIRAQATRSYTALKHSFDTDAYWFYNIEGHYIAQHMNSTVVKVHKGKPSWLYTPHTNTFSYLGSNSSMVTRRYPVIGASLYCKTTEFCSEYDMSDWISDVRIILPENDVAISLPLSVLVLGWGLANEVCFEGGLSTMEITLMSDVGEEKRYSVLTEAEIEDGEIIEGESDDEEGSTLNEVSSTDSDESPAPSSHPLRPTPEENLEEIH